MKKQLIPLLIILNSVCWGQKKEVGMFDTTVMIMRTFIGDDYNNYQALDDRRKNIFDSLDKRGVTTLQNDYLAMEAFYMKPGRKVEKFRQIRGNSIFILEYIFWHKNNTTGYELKKEYEVK